jgi:Fe-Mn family superoxide dismutase
MSVYAPRDFSRLIGTPGFSDKLLNDHFTLYQGYVKNTNTLLEKMSEEMKADRASAPAFAEMKRRFGWEFDGMRLHELYFESFGKEGGKLPPDDALARQLSADFGSVDAFTKEFKATGAMRGIGWTALVWDPVAARTLTVWINEHDGGHLAGCPILLIMDVFEHAFFTDYGLKRADYIEAFWKAVQWKVVASRFAAAHREVAEAVRH